MWSLAEGEIDMAQRKEISSYVREGLYRGQKGRCMYCGHEVPLEDIQVDHKTPITRGGSDSDKNLQLLCASCNSRKGAMTDGEFRRIYKSVGLLPARQAAGSPTKVIPIERFEDVSKAISRRKTKRRRRYHSRLHDSDNRYHLDPKCPMARNIKNLCTCSERQPKESCQWCS